MQKGVASARYVHDRILKVRSFAACETPIGLLDTVRGWMLPRRVDSKSDRSVPTCDQASVGDLRIETRHSKATP